MNDDDELNILAKHILGFQVLIGFFVFTALVIHYGVAPVFERLISLISVSAYWKGVIHSLIMLFILWLFIISLSVGPRGVRP